MMNGGSCLAGRGCRCQPEDAHSQDMRVCVFVERHVEWKILGGN